MRQFSFVDDATFGPCVLDEKYHYATVAMVFLPLKGALPKYGAPRVVSAPVRVPCRVLGVVDCVKENWIAVRTLVLCRDDESPDDVEWEEAEFVVFEDGAHTRLHPESFDRLMYVGTIGDYTVFLRREV